jgi:hypothetical protein
MSYFDDISVEMPAGMGGRQCILNESDQRDMGDMNGTSLRTKITEKLGGILPNWSFVKGFKFINDDEYEYDGTAQENLIVIHNNYDTFLDDSHALYQVMQLKLSELEQKIIELEGLNDTLTGVISGGASIPCGVNPRTGSLQPGLRRPQFAMRLPGTAHMASAAEPGDVWHNEGYLYKGKGGGAGKSKKRKHTKKRKSKKKKTRRRRKTRR